MAARVGGEACEEFGGEACKTNGMAMGRAGRAHGGRHVVEGIFRLPTPDSDSRSPATLGRSSPTPRVANQPNTNLKIARLPPILPLPQLHNSYYLTLSIPCPHDNLKTTPQSSHADQDSHHPLMSQIQSISQRPTPTVLQLALVYIGRSPRVFVLASGQTDRRGRALIFATTPYPPHPAHPHIVLSKRTDSLS